MTLRSPRIAPLVIALGAAAAAALVLIDRTPGIPVDQLATHLNQSFPVRVRSVRIAPGGDAPWGPGEPVQIWSVAADEDGTHLFHVSGRRQADHVALSGTFRRLPHSNQADALLALHPERALIATAPATSTRTLQVHHRAGGVGALRLTRPSGVRAVEWTTDGFVFQSDAGPIRVAGSTVDPPDAGVWTPDAAPPPAHMVGLNTPVSASPLNLTDQWARLPLRGGAIHVSPPRLALRYQPDLTASPTPLNQTALRWIAAPRIGGVVVNGQVHRPVQRGGAAVWIDARGQTAVGLFAGEPGVPSAGAFRQAGPALVLDGKAVQLDPDPARPRAGLGVRADGRIVVGQSDRMTRLDLARALARSGAVQAIEVRSEGLLPADARPDSRLDWFAVVAPEGLMSASWRAKGWRGIAPGRLALKRHEAVDLVLIETDAVRLQIAPGLADIGGALPVPPQGHWLLGGVRSARAPYGLKLGEDVRRAPRDGKLALIIDERGRASMRAVRAEGPTTASVLQGPLLLRRGQPAIETHSPAGEAISAIGQRADGRFVFAHTQAGTEALVAALQAAEVQDAMRMGDRSTADAGQALHFEQGTPRSHFPTPVTPGPWAGTALVVEATPLPPQLQPAQAIRIR